MEEEVGMNELIQALDRIVGELKEINSSIEQLMEAVNEKT